MVRRDEGGTHSIGTDGRRFGVHDEGNNETCPFVRNHCWMQPAGTHTVQTQNFSENEDKDLQKELSSSNNARAVHTKPTMPTKSRGCCAVPRTPASPTIPIAKPAARPARPTDRPAPSWTKPWYNVIRMLTVRCTSSYSSETPTSDARNEKSTHCPRISTQRRRGRRSTCARMSQYDGTGGWTVRNDAQR